MTAIRGLKQEIGRLKNTMKGPDYGQELIMHPSEDAHLHLTRELNHVNKTDESIQEIVKTPSG